MSKTTLIAASVTAWMTLFLSNALSQELLQGHKAALTSLDFSDDGKLLLSNSLDGLVLIWDVEKREVKRAFGAARGDTDFLPNRAALMPDGKSLLVASAAGGVQRWDIKTGEVQEKVDASLSITSNLAVSPDGKYVAWDDRVLGGIKIWNARFDRLEKVGVKSEAFGGFVEFSPDGTKLLATAEPSSIGLWDIKSGKQIAKKPGRPQAGMTMRASFSPQGRFVAQPAGFNDKGKSTVVVWDARIGETVATLTSPSPVFISHTSFLQRNVVVTSGTSTAITLWNVDTGQVIATLGKEPNVAAGTLAKYKALAALEVSPDGTLVATCASDGNETDIRLWDVSEIALPPIVQPAAVAGAGTSDFRTWTSSNGQFKVEAMLVQVDDGNVVMLTRQGRAITVRLNQLSDADQRYVASSEESKD